MNAATLSLLSSRDHTEIYQVDGKPPPGLRVSIHFWIAAASSGVPRSVQVDKLYPHHCSRNHFLHDERWQNTHVCTSTILRPRGQRQNNRCGGIVFTFRRVAGASPP